MRAANKTSPALEKQMAAIGIIMVIKDIVSTGLLQVNSVQKRRQMDNAGGESAVANTIAPLDFKE